ncbi:hypothetical protein [Zavarzinia sp. CC-PAN008]|uniref:hypothetical protein n=1 Tax=Zavarzinia sp. CC-PAN008 TaxID=3243332 RepID=UPI003F747A4A
MSDTPAFDVRGLWRRASIAFPDGSGDTTTLVYWLQGVALFADIRVPPESPALGGGGLASLDRADLAVLAGFRGFAGRSGVEGDICTWHRPIDWQPDNGTPDIGRLSWQGADLIEDGTLRDYREVWVRETAPGDGLLSLDLVDPVDGRRGVLVRAADHFIYARGRRAALPPAEDLAALLAATADLEAARSLFDAEIAWGRIADGWRILRSTHPWREGALLAANVGSGDTWQASESAPDGTALTRAWNIVDRE